MVGVTVEMAISRLSGKVVAARTVTVHSELRSAEKPQSLITEHLFNNLHKYTLLYCICGTFWYPMNMDNGTTKEKTMRKIRKYVAQRQIDKTDGNSAWEIIEVERDSVKAARADLAWYRAKDKIYAYRSIEMGSGLEVF